MIHRRRVGDLRYLRKSVSLALRLQLPNYKASIKFFWFEFGIRDVRVINIDSVRERRL